MARITQLITRLAHADRGTRSGAAVELYALGAALGESVVQHWRTEPELATLLTGFPTVGIAVRPAHFRKIHAAAGSPRLAEVPSDQYAEEFELHIGGARLDILTKKGAEGVLARFLEKIGEGIQQVEYPVTDVDRATELLRERFGLAPVYPQTRAGADGTRVNFFLTTSPEGRKVLIELVEEKRNAK